MTKDAMARKTVQESIWQIKPIFKYIGQCVLDILEKSLSDQNLEKMYSVQIVKFNTNSQIHPK